MIGYYLEDIYGGNYAAGWQAGSRCIIYFIVKRTGYHGLISSRGISEHYKG